MKFITTASYYGTGSSAITDLLSEYNSVASLPSEFECRIAHDMFGLSDLEYYLVDNYHRHNSSVAIKMFKRLLSLYGDNKYIKMENYPHFLGNDYIDACNSYIEKLAPIVYQGGCHADIYMKSDVFIFLLKIKERIFHMFHSLKITANDDAWLQKKETPYEKACRRELSYITYPRDFFLDATKAFTSAMFASMNQEGKNFLMIDQLVPPTNTMRYCRYFDDIKVIVVDRDPRDLYYLEKFYWKGNVIPTEPHAFVEWYKATRSHKKYEADDKNIILRVQFEDLVLKYDEIKPIIERFVGLSKEDHINPHKFFNPQVSKGNIGKWRVDKSEYNNIRRIESLLPELCLR